jgi:hypothetical protein
MVKKVNEKKPVVTVDNKDYYFDDLNQEQQVMLAHVQDLDRKLTTSKFNLQQLQFGRQAFHDALAASFKDAETNTETKEESNKV